MLCFFRSSFQRKLESSSCCWFVVIESRSFHSPFGRAAYFLCLHKESKQRNAPRMPRPPRCALRVRKVMPGFVERTSLCVQRTRAHHARDPGGPFRHALAAANGAQDQERRQEHAALDPGVPIALRRQRTIRPAGCARGIARIPLLHRMCNSRNPADGADPKGAMLWGVLLWLLSTHERSK